MSRADLKFVEIFNRIYAAAVAGENDAVTLDKSRRGYIYSPDWPSDHRNTLGLTRT